MFFPHNIQLLDSLIYSRAFWICIYFPWDLSPFVLLLLSSCIPTAPILMPGGIPFTGQPEVHWACSPVLGTEVLCLHDGSLSPSFFC